MVGDTQLVMPNIVDAYNQGAAQGRADRTRRTLSQYLQPALGGDQGALAQIYSADPQAGVQTQNEAFHQQQQAYTQQQQAQQSDQQTKQFADADLQRLGQHARLIANAAQSGNMALANSIYQSVYPEASKILGSNLPQTLTPDQLPNIQKLADTVAPLPQAKPEFQSAIPTGQLDASGQPITQAGWVQYGKPFQPLQGPGATSGATPSPNLNAAPQGTLAQAVMAQESGGNPNAVSPKGAQGLMQLMPATAANPGFGIQPARDNSPQENMRVGSQYLTALGNKYGGDTNLTLAAYNAGPGRVDQALQAAGGDPTKALASLPAETQAYVPGVESRMGGTPSAQPLAFGQSSKGSGPKDTSVVMKRAQDLQDYQKQGITLSADQQKNYMLTGKIQQDQADGPLDPDREAIAQGIASYKYPISSRFMQTPANQALMARASQINPSLNVPQYAQNQKVLTDLASSSPTSSGGAISAAGVGLSHLADLASVSQKLPNNPGLVNSATNAFHAATNTGDASSLKDWSQAKDLVAGEVSKMVKGGVASESEVKGMLDNLNPNDPNRNEAIATLAKFMTDKVQAMEAKRDSVLGEQSPGTSFLNAKQQTQAKSLIGLSKNYDVPDFLPPGGMGMKTQSAQPSTQPAKGWSIQLVSQ